MKESFLVVEGKSPKRTREQLTEFSLSLFHAPFLVSFDARIR